MFITFEGPEGCGKSTQAALLAEHLKEKGVRVWLTHEPGGTLAGQAIRQLLLFSQEPLAPESELLLFAADRREHVTKVILPALEKGETVICDRFTDSTLVYQIDGSGLPEDLVRYLNMVSAGAALPDLTILLDLPPEIGLERAATKKKTDRYESETLDFHRRIRAGFLRLAAEQPERIRLLDSCRPLEEVQAEIRRIVDEKLRDQK